MVRTLNRCSSHSSCVETQLHWQTNSGGNDTTDLSNQHWFSIMQSKTGQQSFQSFPAITIKCRSSGQLEEQKGSLDTRFYV